MENKGCSITTWSKSLSYIPYEHVCEWQLIIVFYLQGLRMPIHNCHSERVKALCRIICGILGIQCRPLPRPQQWHCSTIWRISWNAQAQHGGRSNLIVGEMRLNIPDEAYYHPVIIEIQNLPFDLITLDNVSSNSILWVIRATALLPCLIRIWYHTTLNRRSARFIEIL